MTAVGRNKENIYEVNEKTNGKKISEPVVRTEKCNILRMMMVLQWNQQKLYIQINQRKNC